MLYMAQQRRAIYDTERGEQMAKLTKAQQQRELDVYDTMLQMRLLTLALEGGQHSGFTKDGASAVAIAAFRVECKLRELLPLEA